MIFHLKHQTITSTYPVHTMATKAISTQIEKFFEDRLKAITKELKYSEKDITALLEANKKMSTSSRTRKPRDPSLPKPPSNGYILYCNEMRKKLKEEHPEIKGQEVMKILGAKWKAEDENIKKRYIAEYKKQKEEYDRQIKEIEANKDAEDSVEEVEEVEEPKEKKKEEPKEKEKEKKEEPKEVEEKKEEPKEKKEAGVAKMPTLPRLPSLVKKPTATAWENRNTKKKEKSIKTKKEVI